jgi:hypothetical protein
LSVLHVAGAYLSADNFSGDGELSVLHVAGAYLSADNSQGVAA